MMWAYRSPVTATNNEHTQRKKVPKPWAATEKAPLRQKRALARHRAEDFSTTLDFQWFGETCLSLPVGPVLSDLPTNSALSDQT